MNNGTRENAFTEEEKFIQLTLTALQFVILAMWLFLMKFVIFLYIKVHITNDLIYKISYNLRQFPNIRIKQRIQL